MIIDEFVVVDIAILAAKTSATEAAEPLRDNNVNRYYRPRN